MAGHHEEEALGKLYDSRLTRRLLGYLRPYRNRVIAAVFLSLASGTLAIAGPLLLKITVDRFLVPALARRIGYDAAMRGIGWIALIYLAALSSRFALDYAQTRMMQRVGQLAMYDLRHELFERLQNLPLAFFDRNPLGRLVTRLTTDVDTLNDLFASGVVAMLGNCFILAAIVVAMLKLDWRLALAAFSVIPLIVLATLFFRRSVRDANRKIRVAIARINSFLQEHITGMSVVQLFNREKKARAQFAEANRAHMVAYKDAILAFALFYPAVEFLGVLAIAIVLWYGGLRVLAGTLGLGTIVAFIQYAQQFFRPIQDLSEKFNILQTAMASSERIFRLLDEPITIQSPENPVPLGIPRGEIEFSHVWFAYTGGAQPSEEDWVLRDVSFRVLPGQTVAIVGHTGAGKTTLTSLMMRFYDVTAGQILIDGVDLRQHDLKELRRHFAVVLQDPFLFTGTIGENIRLGNDTIPESRLREAARDVNVLDFIDSLPGRFDEPVRERGNSLSTGQKQLINFARALAYNPRILILDEATSSVDTDTELRIRSALERMVEGRTSVLIAHRLSTVQRADTILVMHKGQLREMGSHQQLLAQRGLYWKLYQLQYKDQEIGATPLGEPSAATAD